MRNSFDEKHNKGSFNLTTIVDVSEWHKLNQKEFLEHYSYNELEQKVEFIRNRFELFAKRVNKKTQAILGEKIIESELQAFVRYFAI